MPACRRCCPALPCGASVALNSFARSALSPALGHRTPAWPPSPSSPTCGSRPAIRETVAREDEVNPTAVPVGLRRERLNGDRRLKERVEHLLPGWLNQQGISEVRWVALLVQETGPLSWEPSVPVASVRLDVCEQGSVPRTARTRRPAANSAVAGSSAGRRDRARVVVVRMGHGRLKVARSSASHWSRRSTRRDLQLGDRPHSDLRSSRSAGKSIPGRSQHSPRSKWAP